MKLSPRPRIAALLFMLLLLGILYVTAHYLWKQGVVTRDVHEPAIVMVRVGGVPWYPERTRPVEVMVGLPTPLTCDTVPPTGRGETSVFRFSTTGVVREEPRCRTELVFRGAAGSTLPVTCEYLIRSVDGSLRPVETLELEVELIPAGEFLRVRSLATPDEIPLLTLSVPQEVIPYAEGALHLPGEPEDYRVLFFVQELGSDRPMLQVYVPRDEPGSFEVNAAPLKRYRSWGDGLEGYAAWPGGAEPGSGVRPPPILVGNIEDVRVAFEVYAGLFLASEVEKVRDKAIRLEESTDTQSTFVAADLTLAEVKGMTFQGWLSPPLRVVRTLNVAAEGVPSAIER